MLRKSSRINGKIAAPPLIAAALLAVLEACSTLPKTSSVYPYHFRDEAVKTEIFTAGYDAVWSACLAHVREVEKNMKRRSGEKISTDVWTDKVSGLISLTTVERQSNPAGDLYEIHILRLSDVGGGRTMVLYSHRIYNSRIWGNVSPYTTRDENMGGHLAAIRMLLTREIR